MSIRHRADPEPEGGRIYVAPSGVQKERIRPEDIFVLDEDGHVLQHGAAPGLKLSECTPLFEACYKLRDAGAVIHSHSINAVLATMLFQSVPPTPSRVGQVALGIVGRFSITGFEMQKGIRNAQGSGHKVEDELIVPIIGNTEKEADLSDSLKAAIQLYPDTQAVLVKNHGVYVWGDTWQKAKTQAECYDYLFRVAVEKKRLKLI